MKLQRFTGQLAVTTLQSILIHVQRWFFSLPFCIEVAVSKVTALWKKTRRISGEIPELRLPHCVCKPAIKSDLKAGGIALKHNDFHPNPSGTARTSLPGCWWDTNHHGDPGGKEKTSRGLVPSTKTRSLLPKRQSPPSWWDFIIFYDPTPSGFAGGRCFGANPAQLVGKGRRLKASGGSQELRENHKTSKKQQETQDIWCRMVPWVFFWLKAAALPMKWWQ